MLRQPRKLSPCEFWAKLSDAFKGVFGVESDNLYRKTLYFKPHRPALHAQTCHAISDGSPGPRAMKLMSKLSARQRRSGGKRYPPEGDNPRFVTPLGEGIESTETGWRRRHAE